MIQPLEFKREYIHNNPSCTDEHTSLETMIDTALKYRAYDNTTYCTLYLLYLSEADIKVLAKYAEAGYKIGIKTAHHCDGTEEVELTICYYY